MKILKLRFKNLNSLEGEWSIDFTDPTYISEGIFAITGPTGAGKSTILDAITLGLYAQTPRLGKITGNFNELMSRRCGDCFSQVTFKSSKGVFSSHFSQHRSKRKPGGNLQPPKHEIFDEDGKIIETGLSKVPNVVKEKTGIDFERFTKSILLAQGGFAAFLEASPGQRAPILEEITGTEIYSQISIKVHDKKREESKILEKLEAEISGISLLDKEDEEVFKNNLEELTLKEKKSRVKLTNIADSINWLHTIEKIDKDLNENRLKLEDSLIEDKKLEGDKNKLELANKALLVDPYHKNLKEKIESLEKYQQDLMDNTNKAPKKEDNLKLLDKKKKVIEESIISLSNEKIAKLNIIKDVRGKDIILNELKKQVNEVDKELKISVKNIALDKKSKKEIDSKILESVDKLKEIDEYLASNIENKRLLDDFYKIKSLIELLDLAYKKEDELISEIKSKEEEKKLVDKDLDGINKNFLNIEELFKAKEKLKNDLNFLISTTLDNRDIKDLRNILGAFESEKNIVIKITELLDNQNEEQKSVDKNISFFSEKEKEIKDIIEQEKKFIKELEHIDKIVRHLKKEIDIITKIANLEAEREKLEENKPCPLCGSTDHPYANDNLPQIRDEELSLKKEEEKREKIVGEIEKIKEERIKLDSLLTIIKQRLSDSDLKILNLKNEINKNLKLIDITDDDLEIKIKDKTTFLDENIQNYKKIISDVDELNSKIKSNQKELDDISKQYFDIEKNISQFRNKIVNLNEFIEKLNSKLDDVKDKIKQEKREILAELRDFGIDILDRDKLEKIVKDLNQRLTSFKETSELKAKLKKRLDDNLIRLESINKIIAKSINDMEIKETLINEKRDLFEKLLGERKELFGDKDPDIEEVIIEKEIKDKQLEFNILEKEYLELKENLISLKENIKNIEKSIDIGKKDLNRLKNDFTNRLETAGFRDEKEFLDSSLSEDDIKILGDKINKVEKELTELKSVIKSLEEKLLIEKNKKLTNESLEDLDKIKEELDNEVSEINKKIGEINSIILQNDNNRKRLKQKLDSIEKQKIETIKWNNLHDLIGSADGKKFRNFAQGLTFEIMVNLANKQLKEMTDRYLLIRDKENPLELNVLDNYQAGEIRSSKNLSGGEGFLVSLCLALGLSNMAGKNIEVDSLFLDEGFGTLDDESLETALETLSKLNQSGKTIGIISHVQALKERILVQINVEPLTGGKSFITGPGCKKLSNS